MTFPLLRNGRVNFVRGLAVAVLASAPLATSAPGRADDLQAAQKSTQERLARYNRCVDLARTDADAARREAARWEAIGGGAQARHCAAIALVGQGATREAAQILTEIGSEANSGLGAEDRVVMLSLAGELWLEVGLVDAALRSFETALKLNPQHRSALIGAAHVAAGRGDHAAAEAHLTTALKQKPKDAEALTFRAAARRLQDKRQAAFDDASQAVKLRPNSAPAWFEKGAAERELDKKADARESWIKAAMLDLDGQVGEDARHALAVLDAGR